MEKWLKYFLIAIVVIGVFFRFYSLNGFLYGDEIIQVTAALKLHHESWRDGMNFEYQHPPLAKWLMGTISKGDSEYKGLGFASSIPPLHTFIYALHKLIAESYVQMRIVSAIAGVLFVAFIYLTTKKIFGVSIGLWAAALAAISADAIFFSRVALNENFMLLFSLLTVYFYLQYLSANGNKKYILIFLTGFFLFFSLGTRSVQPLFLIPTLVLCQIFYRRKKEFWKENLVLLAVMLFSLYSIFFVLYKPEVSVFSFYKVSSITDAIGFSFPQFSLGLLVRNSYLHLISLFLILFVAARKLNSEKMAIAEKIYKNKSLFVFIAYFLISFFALGFSRAGDPNLNPYSNVIEYSNRYAIVLYPTLFIVGAYALSKNFRGIFKTVVILAAVASLIQIALLLPNGLHDYSNFGIRGYEILGGAYVDEAEMAIKFLENSGSPLLMTNEVNLLEFYNASPFFEPYRTPMELVFHHVIENKGGDVRCIERFVEATYSLRPYIVYRKTDINVSSLVLDGNFCMYFQVLNLTEVFKTDNIMIYKIEDGLNIPTPSVVVANKTE